MGMQSCPFRVDDSEADQRRWHFSISPARNVACYVSMRSIQSTTQVTAAYASPCSVTYAVPGCLAAEAVNPAMRTPEELKQGLQPACSYHCRSCA